MMGDLKILMYSESHLNLNLSAVSIIRTYVCEKMNFQVDLTIPASFL
jgi:hypothetical protein